MVRLREGTMPTTQRARGPLGFNSPNTAQRHALHVERTAEKAFMLSDRDQLSSAEARVEEIKGSRLLIHARSGVVD